MRRKRQRYKVVIPLLIAAAVGTIAVGAFGGGGGEEAEEPLPDAGEGTPTITGLTTGEGTLRASEQSLEVQHTLDELADNMMSGGPPPDGIPSIDEPRFVGAEEAELDPGDKVVGLVHDGVVRAYPQSILVYHEIVNHKIGDENVAVTYCPLTATAQAFKTGSTTLGVSGRLVNSNLVMYDRDTGSLWPQIVATSIAGEHAGQALDELELYWTTWERWREQYPETEVLSSDTGHVRDYNQDPYGAYNPAGGYYTSDRTMFPVMHEDEYLHPKHMVVGARTESHAVFFDLDELREAGLQTTGRFLGVYNRSLDTGYIYALENNELENTADLRYDDGLVQDAGSGETFSPGELPFNRLVAVEAFYFAWNAFYPESEHP